MNSRRSADRSLATATLPKMPDSRYGEESPPSVRSKIRLEMIDAGGRLCQLLGLPRSTGQIYGLLYLSLRPLSLDDVVELLGISKASASLGTRQLLSWGAVRQVWIPGNRRDHFEVVADLGNLVRGSYHNFLKPRLASSRQRLDTMASALDAELAQGVISPGEHKLCSERLEKLVRLQKKMQRLTPLAEKFF